MGPIFYFFPPAEWKSLAFLSLHQSKFVKIDYEVISRYPEYLLLCLAQGSEGCYIIIFCVMIFNQFESATRFW